MPSQHISPRTGHDPSHWGLGSATATATRLVIVIKKERMSMMAFQSLESACVRKRIGFARER